MHHIFFSVPLDEKVPEGVEPRFWEEEGFYVGEPPQVSSANLNIMENRIKEGNQVGAKKKNTFRSPRASRLPGKQLFLLTFPMDKAPNKSHFNPILN